MYKKFHAYAKAKQLAGRTDEAAEAPQAPQPEAPAKVDIGAHMKPMEMPGAGKAAYYQWNPDLFNQAARVLTGMARGSREGRQAILQFSKWLNTHVAPVPATAPDATGDRYHQAVMASKNNPRLLNRWHDFCSFLQRSGRVSNKMSHDESWLWWKRFVDQVATKEGLV